MPFALATIPFTPTPTGFGVFAVHHQRAIVILGGSASRLSTSIVTWLPGGGCAALTSIGFNAGVAPAGTSRLSVDVNAATFENAMVTTLGAFAAASAGLRIFIEEFTGTGAFVRSLTGPTTMAFDARAIVIGGEIRIDERRRRSASAIVPVSAGRFYRVWVDLVQDVACQGVTGFAQSVNNFSFDFAPVFFAFA